jgi:hypothetical protein
MIFMEAESDRLDAEKSGELDVREIARGSAQTIMYIPENSFDSARVDLQAMKPQVLQRVRSDDNSVNSLYCRVSSNDCWQRRCGTCSIILTRTT